MFKDFIMRKISPQELAIQLNTIRQENPNLLTQNEIDKIFKDVPYRQKVFSFLQRAGHIIRINNKWSFTEEPIYYQKMELALKEIRSNLKGAQKEYNQFTVDSAMEYLKSQGFNVKIWKEL